MSTANFVKPHANCEIYVASPEDQNYRFGDFTIETSNRQLRKGDEPVELSARYFDALVLLVREHGQLLSKDRLFEEVWHDVVVSDSALTQCIKTIRGKLGDDAANPRFIQTVPSHGYRFVAAVEAVTEGTSPAAIPLKSIADLTPSFAQARLWVAAGTLGGAFSGVLGGLLYGTGLAYTPADVELGTASVLLVLLGLNVIVGLVGGFGVSLGIAGAWLVTRGRVRCSVLGAALGGLVVGAMAKLVGVDAFHLILGSAPTQVTGGLEGAVLGAFLALGARLGGDPARVATWRPILGAGLATALAGALLPAAGGRLMGGSLELLATTFPESRLQLGGLGRFFGEDHFGQTTQIVLGSLEGLFFGVCVAGALVLIGGAWRRG
ncbi:MAG: DNA-binding winged helix-turn-helix (wHTH) protein [Rhodothermales bacterium]|jgi:DNA-binding winged helix-turn-helix (wHTH) protein